MSNLVRPSCFRIERFNRSVHVLSFVCSFVIFLTALLCGCNGSNEERQGGKGREKNLREVADHGTRAQKESIWVINSSLIESKVFRIDPANGNVVARTRINGAARGIAAGEGAVWISDFANDKLLRIDPASNRISAQIDVPHAPTKIAIGNDSVWVISSTEGVLAKIDPSTNKIASLIPVTNSFLTDVAFGEGAIWVASENFLVSRVDTEGMKVIDAITVIGNPSAVIVGGGSIWLSNPVMKELLRIDVSSTGLTTLKLQRAIGAMTFGQGALWIGMADEGTIVRFDVEPFNASKTMEVGHKISGLSFGEDALWATSKENDTVYRIDPVTCEIRATVTVEGGPTGIAVGWQ